jgi:sugar phosphate isomerase/epimerase
MVNPRLSVSALSSVRWSFEQDLALWADLGLCWAGLLGAKLGDDVEAAAGALAAAGIRVSTVAAGRFDLGRPDTWEQTRAGLHRVIDAVAKFGGWSVYITPGASTGAPWEDLLDTFTAAVAPTVAHAADRGVLLGFEPSRRTEVSFVNTLRDAIDVAGRTGLGIVADVGNFWMERGLAELLARAAPHICLVQLADVEIGRLASAADPPGGGRTPLGEGDLAISRILGHISDTGYAGPLELEIIGPLCERDGYEPVIRRAVDGAGPLLAAAGLQP